MLTPGTNRNATQRRTRALTVLVLLVTLAHLWLTREVSSHMPGAADEPGMERMQAAYVTELKVSAPPRAPAPTVKAAAPSTAAKAKPKAPKAASAPDDAASSMADAASAASTPESAPQAIAKASEPAPAASQPPGNDVAVAEEDEEDNGFVWPEATKVTYKIEGFFRGPIYGQASVEWVRKESRYQVHVDASVGPSFAPLGSWRLSSEGAITAEGLSPERYENVNRLLIKTSPARRLTFDEREITLANGDKVPRPKGVQDPASQFIQLAYGFILKPESLKVGNTVRMPLAILTRAETLAYDVVGEEVLKTPIGDVPTFHIKPRRMVESNANLPADIWVAPGLQYLPVRIYVKVNEETYMDMQMDRAPQQAPGAASRAASKP